MASAPERITSPDLAALMPAEARKLVAILSADGVGFSRIMETSEDVGRTLLADGRAVFDRVVPAHGGRLFGVFGDSIMAEFPTAGAALRAALQIQDEITRVNAAWPVSTRQLWRIGIHLGELSASERDLVGDAVNVAARVQALAEPGGIAVSAAVRDVVRGRVPVILADHGVHRVKNLAHPIHVWRVQRGTPRLLTGLVTPRARRILAGGAAVAALAAVAWIAAPEPARLLSLAGLSTLIAPAEASTRSVAVLPFTVVERDDETTLLAEALALDITADLSRFPQLFVVAHESAAQLGPSPVSLTEAAQRLGVRYLVGGSLLRDGDRLRATVMLIDAADGRQVWSDRIETPARGFFALQDQMVAAIASRLPTQLAQADLKKVVMKQNPDYDAFQLWLQSRKQFERMTEESNQEARRLLIAASEKDPRWPRPIGDLGYSYVRDYLNGWGEDPDGALKKGVDLVRRAVAMDPSDYENQWSLGLALLAAEDYEGGLASYQKALALNPGDAALLADYGDALTAVGRPKEAVEAAQRAIKLNPLGPTWYHWVLAYGALMAGEYDLAIETLEGLPERLVEHVPVLASAYARRGVARGGKEGEADIARARELIAAFEKEDPDYSLEVAARQPFLYPKDREAWLEGLRQAGLRATAEAKPAASAP